VVSIVHDLLCLISLKGVSPALRTLALAQGNICRWTLAADNCLRSKPESHWPLRDESWDKA
jgi:hypothetical protein